MNGLIISSNPEDMAEMSWSKEEVVNERFAREKCWRGARSIVRVVERVDWLRYVCSRGVVSRKDEESNLMMKLSKKALKTRGPFFDLIPYGRSLRAQVIRVRRSNRRKVRRSSDQKKKVQAIQPERKPRSNLSLFTSPLLLRYFVYDFSPDPLQLAPYDIPLEPALP